MFGFLVTISEIVKWNNLIPQVASGPRLHTCSFHMLFSPGKEQWRPPTACPFPKTPTDKSSINVTRQPAPRGSPAWGGDTADARFRPPSHLLCPDRLSKRAARKLQSFFFPQLKHLSLILQLSKSAEVSREEFLFKACKLDPNQENPAFSFADCYTLALDNLAFGHIPSRPEPYLAPPSGSLGVYWPKSRLLIVLPGALVFEPKNPIKERRHSI